MNDIKMMYEWYKNDDPIWDMGCRNFETGVQNWILNSGKCFQMLWFA